MFNEEQLNRIKESAKKTKNQGEMAVVNLLIMNTEYEYYTPSQWEIIKYCAEECKRQHSGEMSVYDMVVAWSWMQENEAVYQNKALDLVMIEQLGEIVEPDDNRNGFRTIPIGVTDGLGGWIEKAPHHRIEFLLSTLISAYYEGVMAPVHEKAQTVEDQFYYAYEEIHPFRDGNGRSGKILYNYLLGRLDSPILPPNFWDSSNP